MTNFRDDLTQSGAIASGLPTSAIASDRLELLVIDPSVQDYGQLIDGLRPGVVVYVLHPQQDGIEQITELLQHYNQQIQALHLITHGDRGQLHLGHSLLTTSTLGRYGRSLQRWSTALAPQADILIYGCQVADGVTGYGFIRQLQVLTGANIAASTTPIGHPSLGGTWDLDVTLGKVHTPVVVNPATQQTYPHCFIPTVSISDLTLEEDVGDAVFTVTLSEPATDPVVLDFNTSDFSTTAGEDYTAVSGRLTIPSGGTQAFITVPIIDDDLDEARDGDPFESETFSVDLSIVSGADSTNSILNGFGNITDNDPAPVVNLLNTGVQVTEGVGAVARFTVGLSGPAAGQITVNYTLNNGTATDGEDYFFPDTPSLVFLEQETQKVIEITILDDDIYEKNGVPETFSLEIFSVTGNPSGDGVELGPDRISTVSITDNELAPVVSINSLTVLEDAGTAVLEVTLSNASDELTRVTYTTADDTAVSTGAVIDGTRDYDPRVGTLSFVAGTTSTLLTITVVDDVVEEVNEQFFVNLTGTPVPGSVNLNDGITQGVVTIRDNDSVPIVTVLGDSQAEGTDLAFIVQLSREGTTPVVINYTTVNGTAIAEPLTPEPDGDNDYTATQGSLTFAPGETQLTVVVPTAADEIFEPNETLTLQLSLDPGADNATFTGGSSVGTSTILNDDPAPIISVEDVAVNEGALGNSPGAVFTFLLDRPSQAPVTVTYETADGTAESGGEIEAGTADYTPRTGLLTFAPGSTIQRLTVTVNGDNTFEDGVDETFVLNLSNPSNGSTLSTPQVTGTLLEDDAQPAIAILDTSVVEGNSGETTNAVFTVQLTNPSQSEVTVTYSTGDGTASSSGVVAAGGSDYVPVIDETLVFAPGETQQLITITVNGDDVNEGNEAFTINLADPTGATVADGVGTGTIVNNDGPPAIALLNNAVTVNEGDSGETATAVFTVQLSNPSQTELTVTYSTNDGTARSDGELNAGTADFSPIVDGVDGVLVFAPGETQQLITVTVNGDDTNEPDAETFNVVLNGVTGGGGATLDGTASSGTVTILDDDDQPAIAILDTSVTEGNSGDTTAAIFTVQLSNPSQTEVTVDYSTANITTSTGDNGAAGGDDYVPVVGNTLTFAPGETQQLITIAVNGDDVNELDETFSITLINPTTNATLDDGLGIGTILDDDNVPVVNISNATVLEGNTGDISTAVFTVSLSNPNQAEVTVAYTTEDGTALAGGNGALGLDDYQPVVDGVLTFAAGETQQFITITVNGDGVNEEDETFAVRLSPPTGGPTLGDNPGTGTIIDNDDPPTIAISNASVLEGNLGDTSNAIFTVSLSNPSQDDVTVTYSTADGTASSGGNIAAGEGDFEPVVDGALTFTAGETQRLITIAVNGDGATEGTETFNVNLTSTSAGGGIADGTGVGTIVDNDGPPAIAILGTSVTEGAINETTNAVFTVSLTNPSSEAVTVNYTTANITASTGGALAAGGDDYLPVLGGTVTFAAGEIEQLITITVNGDGANEGDETFSVTLSDPNGGGANLVGGGESAIGTIVDDDPQPAIAILGSSVLEGDDLTTTNAIFTVQLSNPSQTDITVDYNTTDGSALAGSDPAVGGNDYEAASGSLTFVAGETLQLITVTVNGDGVSEPSETFNVVLDNLQGNATVSNDTGVGTIGDDDAQPTITIDSRTSLEGDSGQITNAIFTVRLTTPSQSEVTVNYNTANGTASFGGNPVLGEDDYVPVVDGVLTFAPGAVQQLITITVNGDDVDEADETFDVILSNASGGANLEPDTQATGTIIDDDDPAVITISNASVLEGDLGETSNAVFTVSLSSPTPGEVSVTYSTADDTASSGGDVATGEGDYTPVTDEVIVFAPGETERLITIAVNGDGANEEDETFTVTLNNLTGDATPGDLVGVGTIVDNDGPPAIAISNAVVDEGDSGDTVNAIFTVQLSNPSQNEVTVDYSTANGTANAGGEVNAGTDDYTPLTGTLTFAPGETTALITVTVNGDDVDELDETFTVTLADPSGGAELSGGVQVGTGTITDDDDQAAIAILGTSVLEGDATTTTSAIFTVQLSNPSQTDISVDYNTTDGSASALG
ncbi:Calx-beta domain-containing protein, partial [Leptolyngbya sp. CCY15150]|uniref:Calx-beta domain-containing protein n=1 Tax=Leptolyngbya sp. CCY15150 TaxID=2767772 RepID=UPI00195168F6